ncbi:MAG TPA: V-type ATP synthase subunit A [Planctomycetota bacterium]|nr:V-type ATP synthase subunit A [Planctomycetota bacterium]
MIALRGGEVERVAGPVVVARGLERAHLGDVVRVGPLRLAGEVIRLEGARAVVQVYEDTSGLRAGDPVEATGAPLEVELGPGLLGGLFDGIQRPLRALAAGPEGEFARPFVARGQEMELPSLDRAKRWTFEPAVAEGATVEPGDVLGTVRETPALVHRILVPPGAKGVVRDLRAGALRVDEALAQVGGKPVAMLRRWPVRRRRPVARRLDPTEPLVTHQRVIDTLFPLARGGTATIPGGFGTGKTMQEQTLARFAAVDVIVYIGCGERGNELTEVLEEFPKCVDPRTGASLMDRMVLIANTSNMPVAAREASVYTGITIAEYYRDQGYDVALMADSTSRWGEALREVSGRLEEMPGEEGYPAYLSSRLAEFYERAGAVDCLGRPARRGSVSVIGAVSPPGGDFSEPITQQSLRLAGTFWALDTDLARRRHFPAIHWTRSYTLYDLGGWFDREVAKGWEANRRWALATLQQEAELQEIVQLLGVDALAPAQKAVLETGRRLREDFLQQSCFDPVDCSCELKKQFEMLEGIKKGHDERSAAAAAAAKAGTGTGTGKGGRDAGK